MITIKNIIISLVLSLVLTLFHELIASLLMGIKDKNDIKIVILANLITNPCVVYISNLLVIFSNRIVLYISVAIMEISVIIIEGIIFKKYLKYDKISPYNVSLINNFVSFFMGNIFNLIGLSGLIFSLF